MISLEAPSGSAENKEGPNAAETHGSNPAVSELTKVLPQSKLTASARRLFRRICEIEPFAKISNIRSDGAVVGWVFIHRGDWGEKLECLVRSISRSLNELESVGLIERRQAFMRYGCGREIHVCLTVAGHLACSELGIGKRPGRQGLNASLAGGTRQRGTTKRSDWQDNSRLTNTSNNLRTQTGGGPPSRSLRDTDRFEKKEREGKKSDARNAQGQLREINSGNCLSKQSAVSELCSVFRAAWKAEYPEQFLAEFGPKECGQFKCLIQRSPPELSAQIVDHCVRNWGEFRYRAEHGEGGFKLPAMPNVGVMLKFSNSAANLFLEKKRMIEEASERARRDPEGNKRAKWTSPSSEVSEVHIADGVVRDLDEVARALGIFDT